MNIRRLLAPEVVQTSAMDCGPAALKCLLEGFATPVSYGRLREACQTDVDGASIDTMEEVANQLGLEAEQIMLPADHILLPGAKILPAIAVVMLPAGITHFVVVWRRAGGLVQVMDPAVGRRWTPSRQFLSELYIHRTPVDAVDWRAWAGSGSFAQAVERRLGMLGVARRTASALLRGAAADPQWRSLAALDAAIRMTDSLVRCRGLRGGAEAAWVLERLFENSRNPAQEELIPAQYWPVRPLPLREDAADQLLVRGAVLVRVRGRKSAVKTSSPQSSPGSEPQPLSPELAAALKQSPDRPGQELLRMLRADGTLVPGAVLAGLLFASGGVLIEALLFRGLFDLARELGTSGQRIGAMAVVLLFALALLLLDLPLAAAVLRMGRRLESRWRMAFLRSVPRLGDHYFQSRLTSDMAERGHAVQRIRRLPDLGAQLVRSVFELILTAAGVAWLDPGCAVMACIAAAAAVLLPLAGQPALAERDLRVRSHSAALTRFYLDALLGLVAIRAHGAERAVRREQETLLTEWAAAGVRLQRAVVSIEALQFFSGFGLGAWMLMVHLSRGSELGGVLLLVYWALRLPVLGQDIALLARQYPAYRNTVLRLLEPLGAPAQEASSGGAGQEGDLPHDAAQEASSRGAWQVGDLPYEGGVRIAFEGVAVRAAGHSILEGIDLAIEPGNHIAIVGPSGAGKSSLVGLLLGWHRAAAGQVLVDGAPLDNARLESLRRETAWVDPAVQLWNHSLLENLYYGKSGGAGGDHVAPVSCAIEMADLGSVLEKLPDGLQTPLGEGGALVSGGEGQRVRLGRAVLRTGVRLVILDEPFRGLDRERRRELLERARTLWRDATLLCITHDVAETLSFDRVLVIEGGRVAEAGVPGELARQPRSRYSDLLCAEEDVRTGLWGGSEWRRIRLESGELTETRAARVG